jgi:hypothetical protein
MSLQLNFSDQLVLIDLGEYDEAALLNHIKACHTIVDQLPSHFDIGRRDDDDDERSVNSQKSRQDNSQKSRQESRQENRHENSQKSRQAISVKSRQEISQVIRQDSRHENDSDADSLNSRSPAFIKLSPAVVDSVRSACFSSARSAVVQIVQRTQYSVQGLVDLCFIEAHNGSWIGNLISLLSHLSYLSHPSHLGA